jgi:hypothetical protein
MELKPKGIWSVLPEDLANPECQHPPFRCIVVNGSGKRITHVLKVDWEKEKILRHVTTGEGDEEYVVCTITQDGLKRPETEWIDVPGVKAIAMPADVKEDLKNKTLKKKYRIERGLLKINNEVK